MPETVFGRTKAEIERLPVVVSGRQVRLGDVCRVRCSSKGQDRLSLRGETSNLERVGTCMGVGTMVVEGDAGYGTGEEMNGGTIEILGNAADCLGLALHGGQIRAAGNVGDWCGANSPGEKDGMTGGVILIGGNAGREAGAGMRRGLIYAAGDVGEFCAARMNAGTFLCAGRLGKYAGIGMKRGSLVAGKISGMLPGFQSAGEADTEWLKICLVMLGKINVHVPEEWSRMTPKRYTGDPLEMGKGEILVYDEFE
ncbi:MAG: formylmethanofuran dehydrogenase subunit C [Chloroflexi bacterium]|nr:formylmethanofuran dehydrogenase subunit C [Chloroflexota bacterium]